MLFPTGRCNEGDGRIKIVVGEEPNETTFLVHKPLLCRFSLYFEGALRDRGSASGRPGTIEAATGEFYWPEDDVDEVHRWIRWLYSCPDCKRCPPYDPSHTCKRPIRRPPRQPSETSPRKSREEHRDARGDAAEDTLTSPWCAAEAERAYVFGDRVLSEQYCVVALASFVQHTHFVDPARFVRVCDSVACNAPLRKFVDHWVLWRKFLERGDAAWGPARGSSLINMHEELFGSREGWTSLDPRKFELPHWWQGCARDPNMLCQHRISFGGLYGGAPMVPGGPFAGRVPPSESKKAMQWVCRLSVLAWVSEIPQQSQ
ncbi:hypothetical protein VTK73DRAFT_8523 [Phialemonium thermophilum]|uniref:BTB domain-containing protein n=1 Tax=Phialemonium thermophilum TaxID=223376 RepID=A0ABR3W874_9PEZI